ncbi:MAG: rhodanese-like domain-containing protein [Wenzhouxiangella sp.]|nr:rhodanese-like domain-containing protein [Wenzhouxiangella sp.]TVR95701.1 MAG: rhodanese-like domain-containing protein [Wenzhouxiangellaceae bacterium]
MENLLEFIGNNLLLSGLFVAVLVAWLAWEVARLARKWKEVSSAEAVRLINREDPLIIDASSSADFAKGHIINAINITLSRIEAGNKELLKQRERPVLVYCKNGQASPQIANRLVGLGFTQVHVLGGGLAQWVADQQPVSRQKAARKKDKPQDGSRPRKKSKAEATSTEQD